MSEHPPISGWVTENLDDTWGKWVEDSGAGAFRFCPVCAEPLLAPFLVMDAPRCSRCKREFTHCGCCVACIQAGVPYRHADTEQQSLTER